MGVYCRVRVEMSRSQSVIFRQRVGDQQTPLVGGVWMLTYFRSCPLTPKVVSVTSSDFYSINLNHPWHPWHMCPAISSYESRLSNSGISTGQRRAWPSELSDAAKMVDQTASEPSHVKHVIHSTTMNPHRAKSTNRRAGFNHCGIPKAIKPISFWSNRKLLDRFWPYLTSFDKTYIIYMFFFQN